MARSAAGIGLRIRLGGGKDSHGKWLPAASGALDQRLHGEQGLPGFTSGHPTLLTLEASNWGSPTPCAQDSPLLREALGGDLGELHGLLVPGKGS